jgi:hypothetical protein
MVKTSDSWLKVSDSNSGTLNFNLAIQRQEAKVQLTSWWTTTKKKNKNKNYLNADTPGLQPIIYNLAQISSQIFMVEGIQI